MRADQTEHMPPQQTVRKKKQMLTNHVDKKGQELTIKFINSRLTIN